MAIKNEKRYILHLSIHMSIVFPFHSPPPPRSRNNKHGKQKKLSQVVDGKSSLIQIKTAHPLYLQKREKYLYAARTCCVSIVYFLNKQTSHHKSSFRVYYRSVFEVCGEKRTRPTV